MISPIYHLLGFGDSWRSARLRKHAFPPFFLYCPSYDYFLPRAKGRAKELSGTAHGEGRRSLNPVKFGSHGVLVSLFLTRRAGVGGEDRVMGGPKPVLGPFGGC